MFNEPDKRCCTCRESKPRSEFPPNNSRSEGLSPMCRVCKRSTATRYNHSDKARAARNRYEQTEAGKNTKRAARKKYRQSEKGKLARKLEAQRRQARLRESNEQGGDYRRDFEHNRKLHALCKRLVSLIFNEVLT